MVVVNGREFSTDQVVEFQRLRLAVLETDPYAASSPQKTAMAVFTKAQGINLGEYAALEEAHNSVLGPDYFNRPPWKKEAVS